MNVSSRFPSVNKYHQNTVTPADRRRVLKIQESLGNVWEAVQNQEKVQSSKGSKALRKSEKRALRKSDEGLERKKDALSSFLRFSQKGELKSAFRFSTSDIHALPLDESPYYKAKQQIAAFYDKLTHVIVESSLSLPEKKKRIAVFIGGLCKILDGNVCHGDIKPENILWDEDSFVISDFNGAIHIDTVCEAMKPEFRFESESERNEVNSIVVALHNSKPVSIRNRKLIQKLRDWKIFSSEPSTGNFVTDQKSLQTLRDYLATEFIPARTEGYASVQYLDAMFDYFWSCQKENFKAVCQAFDMRAAGLTIYAILTGTCPPKTENDKEYYIKLEESLKELGLSDRAVSLIRKMAEPHLPVAGEPFNPPVSREELVELQNEFSEQKGEQQANAADVKQGLTGLEKSFAKLSINMQELQLDLINAKSEKDLSLHIDFTTRQTLIETAFKNYPRACECTIDNLNGKKYTTVLLLDPQGKNPCDVLVKKEAIGDGRSLVAYKALSLRSLEWVAIKYFQDEVQSQQAQKTDEIFTRIGEHKGLQKKAKTYQVNERTVEIEPYFAKCDYGSGVFGDLFCSKWKISKETAPVMQVLKTLDNNLQEVCIADLPKEEKERKLREFIDEYGKTFNGIIGKESTIELFNSYKVLVDYAFIEQTKREKEASDLIKNCTTSLNGLKIIDVEQLKERFINDLSCKLEVQKNARKIMVQAIRKCQRSIVQKCLADSKHDDPAAGALDWLKGANSGGFGEGHLDLDGINHISKILRQEIKVKKDRSRPQEALKELLKIKGQVWALTEIQGQIEPWHSTV